MSSQIFISTDGAKPTSNQFLGYFKRKLAASQSSSKSSSSKSSASIPHTTESPQESPRSNTYGCSFLVAVSGETNTKTQLAMEDAHAFIYNYGNRPDEGYFALFDGHAGAQAAQWCAKSLHTMIESSIQRYENLKAENQAFPSIPTPTPSVSSRHGSNISIQSAD